MDTVQKRDICNKCSVCNYEVHNTDLCEAKECCSDHKNCLGVCHISNANPSSWACGNWGHTTGFFIYMLLRYDKDVGNLCTTDRVAAAGQCATPPWLWCRIILVRNTSVQNAELKCRPRHRLYRLRFLVVFFGMTAYFHILCTSTLSFENQSNRRLTLNTVHDVISQRIGPFIFNRVRTSNPTSYHSIIHSLSHWGHR
jgi:hypothetical protein